MVKRFGNHFRMNPFRLQKRMVIKSTEKWNEFLPDWSKKEQAVKVHESLKSAVPSSAKFVILDSTIMHMTEQF